MSGWFRQDDMGLFPRGGNTARFPGLFDDAEKVLLVVVGEVRNDFISNAVGAWKKFRRSYS